MEGVKKEIIESLREQILLMEGLKNGRIEMERTDLGLQEIAHAFPRGVFPTGAVHEFISPTAACAAAANGFISGLLSGLVQKGMFCLWVSTKRSLYPLALEGYGVPPHQIIFVDVKRDKEVLWVMEQGLKCDALAAVVAELSEVSFAESQRLQLAVEKSRVTGFLHRRRPGRQRALACVARWQIRPTASYVTEEMPGVGHPRWEVTLEKIRNGKPGRWCMGWRQGKFTLLPDLQRVAAPKREHYA